MDRGNYAEQREDLLQSIAEDSESVRVAVHELTNAAEFKLDVAERIRSTPLAWALGAFLLGAWLGSRQSREREVPPRRIR